MNLRSLAATALGVLATSSFASVTLVSTAFTGSDSINWSQFGIYGSVAGFGATSDGNPFLVGENGSGTVLQEGPSWTGTFPNGDYLDYSGVAYGSGSGPIAVDFFEAVYEAGAYVMPNFYSDSGGTMYLSAYDSSGNLLGTVSEGVLSGDNPGSATFLGLMSTSPIAQIVYDFPVGNSPEDFAVDSIQMNANASTVPGPAAIAPFALGLLAACRRRKKA